jgi:hypothetical protein
MHAAIDDARLIDFIADARTKLESFVTGGSTVTGTPAK